jgi:hypothetical protein
VLGLVKSRRWLLSGFHFALLHRGGAKYEMKRVGGCIFAVNGASRSKTWQLKFGVTYYNSVQYSLWEE